MYIATAGWLGNDSEVGETRGETLEGSEQGPTAEEVEMAATLYSCCDMYTVISF